MDPAPKHRYATTEEKAAVRDYEVSARQRQRGWRPRVLYPEGGLAGSPGGEGSWEAVGAVLYVTLEEQGELAASLGVEGHTNKEELASWMVSERKMDRRN